jgi:hypothetical protein
MAARVSSSCEHGCFHSNQASTKSDADPGRLDLAVSDFGLTQLNNIAEPIRVYSLEIGTPAPAKPTGPKRRSSLALFAPGIVLLVADTCHVEIGMRKVWRESGAGDANRHCGLYPGLRRVALPERTASDPLDRTQSGEDCWQQVPNREVFDLAFALGGQNFCSVQEAINPAAPFPAAARGRRIAAPWDDWRQNSATAQASARRRTEASGSSRMSHP